MEPAFTFMFAQGGDLVTLIPRAERFLTGIGRLLVGFGLAYELPIVVFYAIGFGLISYRELRQSWRYVYAALAVIAAVATPDRAPLTMGTLGASLVIIYEVSLAFARFVFSSRIKKQAALDKPSRAEGNSYELTVVRSTGMRGEGLTSFLLPFLLLILSLGLRLCFISDMEYQGDEKIAYDMAGQFLRFEKLPLVGLGSSVGIPNPPGFVWIVAAFRALSDDPVDIAIAIAMLNGLAILWFALFFRKRLDPFLVWTAAFLMATTPWAVVFSRKIWAQDLLAPFAVMLLVGLVKAVEDRNPRYWLMAVAALTVLLQLHLSSTFLVVAVPAAILLWLALRDAPTAIPAQSGGVRFWNRADGMFILIGLIAMRLIFRPYVKLIFINLKGAHASINASHVPEETFGGHAFESARGFVQTITGLFFETAPPLGMSEFPPFLGTILPLLAKFTYGAVTILLLLGLVTAFRRRRSAFLWSFILVIVTAHVLYILFISTRAGPSCFLVLYPLSFVLVAAGLHAVGSRRVRVAIAVWIVAINIAMTTGFLLFIHGTPVADSWYGTPYRLQSAELRSPLNSNKAEVSQGASGKR